MKLCLSHESALQCWRSARMDHAATTIKQGIPEDFIPELSKKECAWLQGAMHLRPPIVTTVAQNGNRRRGKLLRSVPHPAGLPSREYILLGKQTLVASPALTLAQLAGMLCKREALQNGGWASDAFAALAPRVLLAQIATELQGAYTLDPTTGDGFRERPARLRKDDVARLLVQSGDFHGKKLLESACALSLSGSHSPTETFAALYCSLPSIYGGRSLAVKPLLNHPIETHTGKRTRTRYADLCFPDHGFIVEVSSRYHEGERANADDTRRNELIREGYTVLTVCFADMLDLARLDEILLPIERAVGTSGRRPRDYEQRRNDLQALMLEVNGTNCRLNRRSLVPPALLA